MISLPTEIGPVSLKECWDGLRKGVGPSGPYVEKTYLLEDWGSTNAAINALRGTISLSGTSTLAVPPHSCPESPNLYCVDAYAEPQCEIDAKDGGRPRFKQALIRCRYGTVPYNSLPSMDPNGNNSFPNDDNPNTAFTYALCRMRIGSEVIRVPQSVFKFASAPTYTWEGSSGVSRWRRSSLTSTSSTTGRCSGSRLARSSSAGRTPKRSTARTAVSASSLPSRLNGGNTTTIGNCGRIPGFSTW